ncbi:MAG: serine/threonine-protein kinase, partial [Spirochaetota bacterium]
MNGRIEVITRIAHGDTADVYEIRRDDAPFAVKVLHPHLANDPVVRARFVREAQALSTINNAHVVRVHALVEHEGRPAMLMELMEGGSIEGERLDPSRTVALLRGLLSGLVELHGRGIVHRDIRPSHILRDRDGTAKLVDFGMASIRDLSGLTRSTVVTSRPHYVDPFSWGRRSVSPVQDLYSLGAVAFESLTGSPPPVSLFSRDDRNRAKAFADLREGTDHFVATVVTLLMEQPSRRPRSAAEVLEWLDAGALRGARCLSECLFCGAPMPEDASICLECGKEPPALRRDPRGEFLVLKKVSEEQEVLSPFLRKLRLLSDGTEAIPPLLTGDTRLYSRAERKEGHQLPVRIVDGVAEESVGPLIELLTESHADRIRVVRYPAEKIRRFKRGPLIRLREGIPVAPATLTALRRLTARTSPAGEQSDLRRECSYALAVAARRLATPDGGGPLDAEMIDALSSDFFAAVGHLEQTERYLAGVNLQHSYSELERADVMGGADESVLERTRAV